MSKRTPPPTRARPLLDIKDALSALSQVESQDSAAADRAFARVRGLLEPALIGGKQAFVENLVSNLYSSPQNAQALAGYIDFMDAFAGQHARPGDVTVGLAVDVGGQPEEHMVGTLSDVSALVTSLAGDLKLPATAVHLNLTLFTPELTAPGYDFFRECLRGSAGLDGDPSAVDSENEEMALDAAAADPRPGEAEAPFSETAVLLLSIRAPEALSCSVILRQLQSWCDASGPFVVHYEMGATAYPMEIVPLFVAPPFSVLKEASCLDECEELAATIDDSLERLGGSLDAVTVDIVGVYDPELGAPDEVDGIRVSLWADHLQMLMAGCAFDSVLNPSLLAERIIEVLGEYGIQNWHVGEYPVAASYCDDCGHPLFSTPRGEQHAEPPDAQIHAGPTH
jgi:hypothetical protein